MISFHKLSRLLLATVVLAGMALQGCVRDKCDMNISYMEYTPVYMNPIEFKSAAAVEAPARGCKKQQKRERKDRLPDDGRSAVRRFAHRDPTSPCEV